MASSHLPRLSHAPVSSRAMGSLGDGLAGLQLNQQRFSMAGRRSSAYATRPSSAPQMLTKDPRPLRDKSWQAQSIRSLIAFLVQAGYNQPVSPKTLQAPSMKDFTSIFKFLYAQLDPRYVFQKKFEEEVPVILRGLRYPFCDQISKSHLASVGSMHAWPSLLAMLTWMVELILCCDQMDNQEDFDQATNAEQSAKVFFEYLSKAYAVFLAGDDSYDTMDHELMATFDRKNEKTVKDVEKLKAEHDVLSKEWSSLHDSESPLTLAERESATLASDIEKFKKYIADHLELKKQKLEDKVKLVEEELTVLESELDKQSAEKAELTITVDSQELSPADVDRMMSERDQLVRGLETLAKKAEETNKVFWEKEMAVQKKMDQLEKLVQSFNTLSYDLGFLSSESKDAQGVNFELELNFASHKVEDFVSVDLQNKIKPLLLKIRSKYNASAHAFEDEAIATQERLDRLVESHAEKCDELMMLETKISKLNDQFNEEKDMYAKANLAASKEMEVIEQDMQRMKLESSASLMQSQQRVEKVKSEYDTLCRRFQESKDSVEKSVLKVLEGMIAMKEHVSTTFVELRENVVADLEEVRNLGTCGSALAG
ncbi:kinetochore-associated Ndc80 complex subunit ndc80 [Podochytrium sp. JEL0797]|nr:kinetochore-associated Ndc80 complex subunit ndc80 [Podochytrium sp. JEL0797]